MTDENAQLRKRGAELEEEVERLREGGTYWQELQSTREALRRANSYAAHLERELHARGGPEPRMAPLVEAQDAGRVDEWRVHETDAPVRLDEATSLAASLRVVLPDEDDEP